MKTVYAFFVSNPRAAEDLFRPHPIEAERQYEIVRVIRLSEIDYENFVTDMLVDRQFLEDNANLCSKCDEVVRCLLVTSGENDGGILIVPDRAWVDCAAFLPNETGIKRMNLPANMQVKILTSRMVSHILYARRRDKW